MSRVRVLLCSSLLCCAAGAALAPGVASAAGASSASLARSTELSETTRLADRRAFVIGPRAYSVATEDGLYPAMGFHIRGEMGGIWSQPIKLLDGIWLRLGGRWLGDGVRATRFSSGWGYTRTTYAASGGVRATRTDVVPGEGRALLVGLTLRSARTQSVALALDAHSELLGSYPWGETTPSQTDVNLPDTGAYDAARGRLVFADRGTPPGPSAVAHDWTAVVGASARPSGHELGDAHRGPQDPPVVCGASGPDAPKAPARCDDTAYGKGTGGQLQWTLKLSGGKDTTVWFAVGGSDQSAAEAQGAVDAALRSPARALARKVREREQAARFTRVSLPGDRRLAQSVEWSKQNLLDSVQESRDLQLRVVNAGKAYPAPSGTLATARWIGAGWPDYPWIFGTDGEYTAFASVAMGRFEDIAAHLRTLRDVSDVVNGQSGKVVHEVTPTGDVYFGANADAGNTDETAKFPSAVALLWRFSGDPLLLDEFYDFTVRNMHYVVDTLDADHDGWPEGLGNVERPGMGDEKLDNTVYTIRGLRDLADMAEYRGDRATHDWASSVAAGMESRFESAWWFGGDTDQYADSLRDPGDVKVFQRHWIGVTPMDALLVRDGQPTRPLADDEHGNAALSKREEDCYSGELGLWHTGTGPTSDPAGNTGPSCDTSVSTVASLTDAFSLNTGIMAVAEGNFGRMGAGQQQRYTTANARIQLDPSLWEQPGSMPEIAPAGEFTPNIDRPFNERSMVLQAWGAYGNLWPVVSQQLGVMPDLGRGALAVVPQIPDGQDRIAGRDIRLGGGTVDVAATRGGATLTTTVRGSLRAGLTIGHVLPAGASVASARLDGSPVSYDVVQTARGAEVRVDAGDARGTHTLRVTLG